MMLDNLDEECLQGLINRPKDLLGMRVGTVRAPITAFWLEWWRFAASGPTNGAPRQAALDR